MNLKNCFNNKGLAIGLASFVGGIIAGSGMTNATTRIHDTLNPDGSVKSTDVNCKMTPLENVKQFVHYLGNELKND